MIEMTRNSLQFKGNISCVVNEILVLFKIARFKYRKSQQKSPGRLSEFRGQ